MPVVVPHSNSTSNHNSCMPSARRAAVVSHSNSTSNHNKYTHTLKKGMVVSHSNSTSNHNIRKEISASIKLFLIPILHQTTTQSAFMKRSARCFSFQFYIKPQPSTASSSQRPSCFSFQFYIKPQLRCLQAVALLVVSHSNSTSNHNLAHGSNSYSARYTYDTDA